MSKSHETIFERQIRSVRYDKSSQDMSTYGIIDPQYDTVDVGRCVKCGHDQESRTSKVRVEREPRHGSRDKSLSLEKAGSEIVKHFPNKTDLPLQEAKIKSPLSDIGHSDGNWDALSPKIYQKRLKPNLQHIPGSYRSDLATAGQTSHEQSIAADDLVDAKISQKDKIFSHTPDYFGNIWPVDRSGTDQSAAEVVAKDINESRSSVERRKPSVAARIEALKSKDSVPNRNLFEASISKKGKAQSVSSAKSRASASRHFLLKPSVSTNQPLDMELPMQPVLTITDRSVEKDAKVAPGARDEALIDRHKHILSQKAASDVLGDILKLSESAHIRPSLDVHNTRIDLSEATSGAVRDFTLSVSLGQHPDDNVRDLKTVNHHEDNPLEDVPLSAYRELNKPDTVKHSTRDEAPLEKLDASSQRVNAAAYQVGNEDIRFTPDYSQRIPNDSRSKSFDARTMTYTIAQDVSKAPAHDNIKALSGDISNLPMLPPSNTESNDSSLSEAQGNVRTQRGSSLGKYGVGVYTPSQYGSAVVSKLSIASQSKSVYNGPIDPHSYEKLVTRSPEKLQEAVQKRESTIGKAPQRNNEVQNRTFQKLLTSGKAQDTDKPIPSEESIQLRNKRRPQNATVRIVPVQKRSRRSRKSRSHSSAAMLASAASYERGYSSTSHSKRTSGSLDSIDFVEPVYNDTAPLQGDSKRSPDTQKHVATYLPIAEFDNSKSIGLLSNASTLSSLNSVRPKSRESSNNSQSKPPLARNGGSKQSNASNRDAQYMVNNGETFADALGKLENLMNKAIMVATQAADQDQTESNLEHQDNSAANLSATAGGLELSLELEVPARLNRLISPSLVKKPSELAMSLRSLHESMQISSSESEFDGQSLLDEATYYYYFPQEKSRRDEFTGNAMLASRHLVGSSNQVLDRPEMSQKASYNNGRVNFTDERLEIQRWSQNSGAADQCESNDLNSADVAHAHDFLPSHSMSDLENIGSIRVQSMQLQEPVYGTPARELINFKGQKSWRHAYEEDKPSKIRNGKDMHKLLNQREVREYIRIFKEPPLLTRQSSLAHHRVHKPIGSMMSSFYRDNAVSSALNVPALNSRHSLDGSPETFVDFSAPFGTRNAANKDTNEDPTLAGNQETYEMRPLDDGQLPRRHLSGKPLRRPKLEVSLQGRSHFSLGDSRGFSLVRSHRRPTIARDWSPTRKRFVAAVSCISTALIGILVGIYAGEVPSIQYYIADFHHYAILGNVFLFIGLALSTFFCWPLPLLHGRKPYIMAAMTIAMPLLFPQAIAVSMQRSPYTATWRVGLLLPRSIMGFVLGFANINFKAILMDLFGASLQSGNPHQEVVDQNDVRRHGGGMGVWLGIWSWCFIGSIGVGFMIGAVIIQHMAPSWGLYVSIIIIAVVLLLNVVTPEVRRSPYRRSLAEVRTENNVSRRIARGEVMMHRIGTGPRWWGEEFHHGVILSLDMLRQPGFLVMAFYVAWIYGQVVLIIVLLGSLISKSYHFHSPYVGACITAVPIGALLAVPFEKASLFSRARHHPQRTDSMTFEKRVTWSSHLVRRIVFTIVLPFANLAYTLSSGGPPTPFMLPVVFAGLIGFLSNLAIAECHGIIMETFDTSDLQPGMTGRPRGSSGERTAHKRTNYSSFPRISSAFAITQSLGFLIAAAATGVGGVAQRRLGQEVATSIMAGILLVLTLLLLAVLVRWKEIQIIPSSKTGDMERWSAARRRSTMIRKQSIAAGLTPPQHDEAEPWRPIIIGNPSGKTRRVSILELGHLSRWSEIRRKNRLIDAVGYEGRHPNLATLETAREHVRRANMGVVGSARERLGAGGRGNSTQTTHGKDASSADGDGAGLTRFHEVDMRGQRRKPESGAVNGRKRKEKEEDM